MLALLLGACGDPLDAQCQAACEHDLRCGVDTTCDESSTAACAKLTSDAGCEDELAAWSACSEADAACSDTCDAPFYAWLLCVVDSDP